MTRSVHIPQTASRRPSGNHIDTRSGGAVQVFVLDDDLNQQLLMILAAEQGNAAVEFTFLDSGAELMMTLCHRLEFGGLPDLILVDLTKDGRLTLGQLQTHSTLWQIPVLALAHAEEIDSKNPITDARWCEPKPLEFDDLVTLIDSLPVRAAQAGFTIELNDLDLTERPYIDLAMDNSPVDRTGRTAELAIDLSELDL